MLFTFRLGIFKHIILFIVLMIFMTIISIPQMAQSKDGRNQIAAVSVQPTVETVPVPSNAGSADDPAIWIHPTDPSLSIIIGTAKDGGLGIYDLAGNELEFISGTEPNNVDLRYNFSLSGQPVALVVISDRSNNSIGLYKVNPQTRSLENVAGNIILPGFAPYGICLYLSPITKKYYCFVTSRDSGALQQWELFDDGAGKIDGTLVRSFDVGSLSEGCVADDELAAFYVGEEEVGIWKYGAEPGDGTTRTLVDTASPAGNFTADVEGLAIYYTSNGNGYLIASSQGSSEFVIYERTGSNDYITTFNIVSGSTVDGVSSTDGVEVANFSMNSAFPSGVFIAHDDGNNNGNENFKLVPWESIANAVSPPLTIDTGWDPRIGGVPPVISLTSPTEGSTFTQGIDINITADASDSDGSVTLVEFFEGANKLGEDSTAPYAFTWSGAAINSYVLTAIATDDDNVTTTSAAINITVQAGYAGPDYYVTPSGSNSNDGSQASPWQMIQFAVDQVGPGDTVNVMNGNYIETISFNSSGSLAGGYITLRNAAGHSPVVDGNNTASATEGLIRIEDHSYIKVIGFELKDAKTTNPAITPAGIYVIGASHHLEIRNNIIHDIEQTTSSGPDTAGANGIGVFGTNANSAIDSVIIHNNEIYNCKLSSSEALVLNGNVKNFIVSNNTVRDCDNIAYDFIGFEEICEDCPNGDNLDQARNGLVVGNIAYNIDSNGNPAYGTERSAAGFYVDGGANILFERNIAHDCNLGFELASEHFGKATDSITVRNNLVYKNHVAGISTGGYASGTGPGGGEARDCNIVNNSFYQNNNSTRPEDNWGAEILLQNRNINNIYKNNIVYADPTRPRVNIDGAFNSGNTIDYNLYFGSSAGSADGSNSVVDQDPLLVDPDNGDLHIANTSPAINAGENLASSVIGTEDYDGDLRILNNQADIGADEAEQATMPALAFRVERATGDVFANGSFIGGGADLAEHINISEPIEPGDVVELDPDKPQYYRKARGSSRLIAGVITTEPGFTLGNDSENMNAATLIAGTEFTTTALTKRPMLALMGRVPVKVTTTNGAIQAGDLLMVSQKKPGYAIRCPDANGSEGVIMGKALESLESGKGMILVLVMAH